MKISTLVILSISVVLIVSGLFFYYITVIVPRASTKTNQNINTAHERRIVAFGDSLTFGYGLATIDDSYPSQLQKKLLEQGYNYKVFNMGVNGETSMDGLARIDSVLSFEPDLVLLEFGANDFLRSQSPVTAQENIEKMIKIFDDKHIQVVLLNVDQNPLLPLPNHDIFIQIMPELAKKYALLMVPDLLKGVLLQQEYTIEDRLHPNKSGYKKILDDNLWPILQKQLIK